MDGEEPSKPGFHVVDYILFIATIGVSLGIGIFYAVTGGRQKTTGEYFLGDRNLRVLPVAISMMVTFISAVGILGSPAEMYAYGTQYSMHVIANVLGSFYGALTFVPLFYPLKLTSVFEYFELRYQSKVTRKCATMISICNLLFYNGVGMYAPSVALQAVSGFPVWASLVLCGVSTTIYTAIGGMKAVIWTDVFQSFIIFGGLLAVVIQGVIKVGGLGEVWRLNDEWGRIKFFDFDPDPTKRTTFWNVVVLMSILFMCITVSQPSVQRYCALKTKRDAQISVFLNIPGFVLCGILTSLCGIVTFAYYAKIKCDPISAGYIHSPNQILPYFVMDVLGYPGLPGVFVACLYSGALSTVSSALNAMAAVTWEDLLKWKYGRLPEQTKTKITKIIVAVYGTLSLAVGFAVQSLGGTFVQIIFSVLGTTAGPIVGMMLLGALVPSAGSRGGLIGAFLGLVLSVWMAVGAATEGIHTKMLPMPIENCPRFRHLFNSSSSHPVAMGDLYNTSSSLPVALDDPFNTSSSLPVALDNTTGLVAYINVNMSNPAKNISSNISISQTRGLHFKQPELRGLKKMYGVSYFWYPAIGMITVLLGGIITSYIPDLRKKKKVPTATLR